MKFLVMLGLFSLVFVSGCGSRLEPSPTGNIPGPPTSLPGWTATAAPTFTPTFTLTPSPTHTSTPTETQIPTATLPPSITPTATRSLPIFTVNQQAFCRYGPSKAYLPAADLYAGDKGQVWGRSPYNKWLWVQLDKLDYQCWVAPSVIDVVGDTTNLWVNTTDNYNRIPSELYGPPTNVRAVRSGDQVTITWDPVYMTQDDDRGYFIEAWVCQDGAYLWWTVGEGTLTDQYHTTYTFKDQAGCSQPSYGRLFTVEKHGYTTPVDIPWPPP